jgi:Zn-finger nucleic acid-binding protein
MEAGSLNCPSCGASVSSDATNCLYCGAMLQTVACPSCFGLLFKGTKFCPHCGAKAQAQAEGTKTGEVCPRCHGELLAIKVGDTPLEQCGQCGGVWVDSATFEQICSDREAQAAALGLHLPPPRDLETDVHYLKCPKCPGLMNRVCYANRSGVVIDVCRKHGIWLDRDELRRIIEFIRAGDWTGPGRTSSSDFTGPRMNWSLRGGLR